MTTIRVAMDGIQPMNDEAINEEDIVNLAELYAPTTRAITTIWYYLYTQVWKPNYGMFNL